MKWFEVREGMLVKHIGSGRKAFIVKVVEPPNPYIEIQYLDEKGPSVRVNSSEFTLVAPPSGTIPRRT